MTNSRPTQTMRVLDYITEFGSITQQDALRDLGVARLASRVSELRRKYGINIIGKSEPVKNRYGETVYIKRYSLGESDANG